MKSILLTLLLAACQVQPTTPQQQPEPRPTLDDFAAKAVSLAGSRLSPVRQNTVASLLVAVANERFADDKTAEFWIALIGVESGFDGSRTSSVGAVGLGQLMPKLAPEFAAQCGLGLGLMPVDVRDDWTNAHLSACLFRKLMSEQGSVPLALAAYNAGAASVGVKRLSQGGQASAETNGHVAKTWVLKSQAEAN